MALRTLDNEEKVFLDKQLQELKLLHLEAKANDSKAYHYDWLQLGAKLHDVINLYKQIIEKDAEYKEEEQKQIVK